MNDNENEGELVEEMDEREIQRESEDEDEIYYSKKTPPSITHKSGTCVLQAKVRNVIISTFITLSFFF